MREPTVQTSSETNLWRRVREAARLLRDTADAWVDDDVPRLAASLAFYTVLSLLPFVILVSAIAGSAFGRRAAEGELMWELRDLIGTASAQAVQALIQSASKSSTAATVLGSLTLAFGASAVVMELRDALNTIWHVPAVASFSSLGSFLRLVRERFYLFGLILGAGFLLLASLAINAFVSAATAQLGSAMRISPPLLHGAVFIVSFALITALFAAVYKVVPDVQLTWQDVIVGASFTSLLFTIGKQLIGIYLGRVNYASTYGAAGSMLIILVWVYYSAQLFFFGAEFTKVYAKKTKRHPYPTTAATTVQGKNTAAPEQSG
jgi:membrane protein